VEDGRRVVRATDLARARRVVAPGVVADERAQLLGRGEVRARELLPRPDVDVLGHHPADELHAGDKRLQVLAVRVASLAEVAEVDLGRVPRVGGAETNRAGSVPRVRLQDRPGELVPVPL